MKFTACRRDLLVGSRILDRLSFAAPARNDPNAVVTRQFCLRDYDKCFRVQFVCNNHSVVPTYGHTCRDAAVPLALTKKATFPELGCPRHKHEPRVGTDIQKGAWKQTRRERLNDACRHHCGIAPRAAPTRSSFRERAPHPPLWHPRYKQPDDAFVERSEGS